MSRLNTEWAIGELTKFIDKSAEHLEDMPPGVIAISYATAAPEDEITKQAYVVERILDRVLPCWEASMRETSGYDTRWRPLREMSLRAKEALERDQELRENLGDNAPEISASSLHPWIWSGAASLWQSGHYHSAVEDAAKKVNAETQNKVDRRDLSETKLFQEVFSDKPADAGKSRLRRMTSDGSDTYRSVQRGAMALAEGIFAGIRNPLTHEADQELDEQVALEYLAALSVLARWVDESEVEHAGGRA